MHNLTDSLGQNLHFLLELNIMLLFVMSPQLIALLEFNLLTLSAGHGASDPLPVDRTEHEHRFLKRSGNNCHLNVKSSSLENDGVEK